MIFETHGHYDDDAFDVDREELLGSFVDNGIELVMNVGANIESCKTTIALTEKYPFIYGAIGVHPSDASELNEEKFQWLTEQCKKEKILAIGEIGLDYYWDDTPKEIQKKWFSRQLELARLENLPVIIHSREAAKDTYDMMKAVNAEEIGGVVHCYSYSKEMARQFLELNFFFGIGGVITFNNAKKLKEAVEFIPLDKIVLETDSPYLAPTPFRGKRNSALNIPLIAKEIATIKGITYDEVIEATFQNGKRLYKMK